MDVLLRLGPECNQKCLFCNVPKCRKVSTDEAIKWLGKIKEKISILSITGGEPTLRQNLLKIIKTASETNSIKYVNLQTNAAMASYKKYASELKQAGLYSAFVAFHSHDETVSNNLTNSNLWKKSVKGIKNLLAEGIIVTLNPVINKLNYQLLPEYIKFVKKEFPGIKEISFSFVQPTGRAWTNKWIVPKYSEVKPYLKKTLEYCKKNSIKFGNPYCGFPLCYFPGFEELSNEFLDNFAQGNMEKKAVKKVKSDKVKSDSCKKCKYDNCCNGVWANYAKIHGVSELNPIK